MAWAPDYQSTSDLKAYLRISDTDDDAQIALAVAAASRAVDTHCGRQFGVVAAQERVYPARWDRRRCRWVIDIDDLMTASGLVVETAAGEVSEYDLEPRNAAVKGRPWTSLVLSPGSAALPATPGADVTVTGSWGWTDVPIAVKQATLLQASRFFARRNSPYGVAGSPDDGSEVRLLARVDPDVAVILGPFKRWWAAA